MGLNRHILIRALPNISIRSKHDIPVEKAYRAEQRPGDRLVSSRYRKRMGSFLNLYADRGQREQLNWRRDAEQR